MKGLPLLGCLLVAAIVAATIGCGASNSSGRSEVEGVADDVHFGSASKATLYEFRAKVKKRGAAAAKAELPQVLESFEGYEKRSLGEHTATYKEIYDKLKAMESSLGSANRDAAIKAAEEIGALADKLPGTADADPEVE